jgi:hypothetical protein
MHPPLFVPDERLAHSLAAAPMSGIIPLPGTARGEYPYLLSLAICRCDSAIMRFSSAAR